MEKIEIMKTLLGLDEDGEKIAGDLLHAYVRWPRTLPLVLRDIQREANFRPTEKDLSEAERFAKTYIFDAENALTVSDFHDGLPSKLPTKCGHLRYRTHASTELNKLVKKGHIGRYNEGRDVYFTRPETAVGVYLQRMGKTPYDSLKEIVPFIQKKTGMPTVVVIDTVTNLAKPKF